MADTRGADVASSPGTLAGFAEPLDCAGPTSTPAADLGAACCTVAVADTRQTALLWCEAHLASACRLATLVLLVAVALAWRWPSAFAFARSSWPTGALVLLLLTDLGLWACRPFSRALYADFRAREAPQLRARAWLPAPLARFWGDLPLMNSVGDLRAYHRLLHAERGAVCLTWVGAKPVVVVNDARLIAQASSKLHNLFPNRPLFPLGATALLFARDAEWKAKKAKLMPLFTSHALSFMQLERTACASVDRVQAALEWKLNQAEIDPASTSAWATFDLYQLLVELLTHEMIEHCFDVKLADADVWKAFPTLDTQQPHPDSPVYHVHRHPYTEAIDYISLHVSAFNPGSQWLGQFGIAALPILALRHWGAIAKGIRSKRVIEYFTTYTEDRQKGVKPVTKEAERVAKGAAQGGQHQPRPASAPAAAIVTGEVPPAPSSSSSVSQSVLTFAGELRGLLGGDIFTTSYLQAQLLEFVLGNMHTTALLLTGVLYHAAHDPTRRMQARLHGEVAALLSRPGHSAEELIAAHFLDAHPSSVLDDLPYLNAALLESQRIYSPGGLTRENTSQHLWIHIAEVERAALPLAHAQARAKSTAAAGEAASSAERIFLPRGTEIHLSNVPHTNAAYWHEPDLYLPDRWLDTAPESPHVRFALTRPAVGAFFPFGLGARKCLGANYAQAQLRLSLVLLLARFEFRPVAGAKPPTNTQEIFQLKQGLVLLPKEPVPVEIRKRDQTRVNQST